MTNALPLDDAAWFTERFARVPVMAILRGYGPDRSVELAQTAWDLGIDCVEVPIQTPQDLEALAAVAAAGAARGRELGAAIQVGAGTVVSVAHVHQAVSAGAAFTVSPGFDPEVARASLDCGLPTLPGVATGTDIQLAVKFGLTWLKAFPAHLLGPHWFKAMAGPFPQVKFAATGGISAANAREYLDAGASVVAVGSALEDPAQLEKLAVLLG